MSYDASIALDFFRAAGKPAKFAKSKVIFSEKDKAGILSRSKIYFLLDGEVSLLAGKKAIGTVKKGEIFGELAAITNAPRTATAQAKTDCMVIALDDAELKKGLESQPNFALMLMGLMIARLRDTVARLKSGGSLGEEAGMHLSAAFDAKRLEELVSGLSSDPPIYYQQGRQIMTEGGKAALMYAVIKGHVAISIGGKVVERLGPGGAFGEAALLDQTPRLATATAETDCDLQPITRQAFLALVKTSPQFGYGMLASLAERVAFLTERMK